MSITRAEHVATVVITLAADGSLIGAHQESIERITDGDVLLTEKYLSAVPLDAAALATVIPAQADLVSQLAAANAQINALQSQLDQANAQASTLTHQLESASTRSPQDGAVTMRQARRALLAAGLLGKVNAIIAEAPGQQGDAWRIDWEFAADVDPASQMVAALAQALCLDDAAMADLFASARAITDQGQT